MWCLFHGTELSGVRALDIRNADGTVVAFVCTAMPQYLKSSLLPLLIACLKDPTLFKDQQHMAGENATLPIDCLHFSWYNRYATKVCSRAQVDSTPHFLYRAQRLQGTVTPMSSGLATLELTHGRCCPIPPGICQSTVSYTTIWFLLFRRSLLGLRQW